MPEPENERMGNYRIAEDEQELKQRAIFGDESTAKQDEMNAASATGFLSEEELGYIRKLQSTLVLARFIGDELDVELSRVKKRCLELINYIAHSSSSKGGAGVQAAISEIRIQKQDIAQKYEDKTEEKASMLDKLKGAGDKLGSGGGFGSDMQIMNRGKKKPWED